MHSVCECTDGEKMENATTTISNYVHGVKGATIKDDFGVKAPVIR